MRFSTFRVIGLAVIAWGLGCGMVDVGQAQENTIPRRGQLDRLGKQRQDDGLRVGQMAPTFQLKSLDGEKETNLTELLKDKPVVLIFGSYT